MYKTNPLLFFTGLIGGIILLGWGVTIVISAVDVYSFSVQGKIIETNIDTKKVINYSKQYNRSMSRKTEYYEYYPVISYSYMVDNKSYTLKEALSAKTSKREAEEYLKKYPSGADVKIYYDKKEPRKATTMPEKFLLAGILMIIVSIGLVIFISKVKITNTEG